jgi:hypothetical protein
MTRIAENVVKAFIQLFIHYTDSDLTVLVMYSLTN